MIRSSSLTTLASIPGLDQFAVPAIRQGIINILNILASIPGLDQFAVPAIRQGIIY